MVNLGEPELRQLTLKPGGSQRGALEVVRSLAEVTGLEVVAQDQPPLDDVDVNLSDFRETALAWGHHDSATGTNVWKTIIMHEVQAHNDAIKGVQPADVPRVQFTDYPTVNGPWSDREHWQQFGGASLLSIEGLVRYIGSKLDPTDTRVDAEKYQFRNIGPRGLGPSKFRFLQSFIKWQRYERGMTQ